MALMLRSKNILKSIAAVGSSGAVRSGVVISSAGTVGLVAGKRGDSKTLPLLAIGAGAALNLVGANALGDGAMAGGATIFGYRMGAKHARLAAAERPRLSAPVAAGPARGHGHGQHRRG